MAQATNKPRPGYYEQIRSDASAFRVEDIASIRFYGDAFGFIDEKEWIEVADPEVIEQFLDGLRHAEGPNLLPGCQAGTFEIRFLPRFPRSRKPFRLSITAISQELGFGERFYTALCDLSKYQAQKTRELVEANRQRIKNVEVESSVVVSLDSRREIPVLLDALTQLDERAFCYTGSHRHLGVDLTLEDKSVIRILLLVETDAAEERGGYVSWASWLPDGLARFTVSYKSEKLAQGGRIRDFRPS